MTFKVFQKFNLQKSLIKIHKLQNFFYKKLQKYNKRRIIPKILEKLRIILLQLLTKR